MTKDKAGGLDELPGSGAVATGSCLPNSFICWFSDDGVLEIEFVGLGGIWGGCKKIRVAVSKPSRREGSRLGLPFKFIYIRELRTDEDAEQATAHWLLRVIEVITRN